MKILNLKFKNINSLSGENIIDFTSPIFTNDGLFAITGKTGAGKSSILDAISLALYGKTPRVSISGTENDVMTRGEKDCFSEVIFEVGGKKWKSTWKQEKNRNGNLKPVSRVIADGDDQIIADQVRACETTIEELLGLSFEQFTKVIMLAQGSFAAFLQANNNEKGELLEQITGTEIYAEISKKVFERNRIEKDKLERIIIELDAIKILSEDEIENLNIELSEFEQLISKNHENLSKMESAKKWLTDIDNLQKQVDLAKQKLPVLEEKLKSAYESFNNSEAVLKSAKEEKIGQELIFIKVRELDTKINEKDKLLKPLNDLMEKLEKSRNDLFRNQRSIESDLKEAQNLFEKKQEWIINHNKYEELVTNYSAIEKDNDQLDGLYKELDKQKKNLKDLEKEYFKKENSLNDLNQLFADCNIKLTEKTSELEENNSSLGKLLENRDLSEIIQEKDKISLIINKCSLLIDIQTQIEKSTTEVKELANKIINIDNAIADLKPKIDNEKGLIILLDQQINILSENINLTKTIQSLESHRKHLKDGEACPLCGSLEHPFALGNIPQIGEKEQNLKLLNKQYKEAVDEIQMKEKNQAKFVSDLNNLKGNMNKEEKYIEENFKKQNEIMIELNNLCNEYAFSREVSSKELIDIRNQKQSEYIHLEQILKNATNIKNKIKKLQNVEIPKLQNEKQIAEKLRNEAETSKKLIEQELKNLEENYLINLEKFKYEHDKLFQQFNYYSVKDIVELNNCLKDWIENKKQLEDLSNKISHIKNNIMIKNKDLESLLNNLEEKQFEKQAIERERYLLVEERLTIFSNKSVDDEEQKLKQHVEQLEKIKERAELDKNNILTELEKNKAIISEKDELLKTIKKEEITNKNIDEINIELNNIKKQLDDLSQRIGANKQALKSNAESIKNSEKKIENREQQKAICRKWGKLNELIGSGDGKKYRNFAQSLTFEHLINISNRQLKKMSERYLLKRSGNSNNPFDLFVVDKFQNNEERTAKNLSGGEKFIISLTLALGLANMASKNMRIDTMFIDEGFGTLDSDYLDVALNALSNLQNEGKIIGVISHLAELKERIATHIEVLPSGNGHSKIQIKF